MSEQIRLFDEFTGKVFECRDGLKRKVYGISHQLRLQCKWSEDGSKWYYGGSYLEGEFRQLVKEKTNA